MLCPDSSDGASHVGFRLQAVGPKRAPFLMAKIFIDVGGYHGHSVLAGLDPIFGFDPIFCFEPAGAHPQNIDPARVP